MLKMSQINHIKEMGESGYRASEIAQKTGADVKTVRKYLAKEDFSPSPPILETRPSILDPYKGTVNSWLDEDRKHWHKQRHTAMRVYKRLASECGYTGSYSVVQRYLKVLREKAQSKASLELLWYPGSAQVDFGEADFYVSGELKRMECLTVAFPYSNNGFSQVFGGENAECVCQGLADIFEGIGGVPPLLVFDNATGVGRRVGDIVRESKLFAMFRAHYRVSVRFCNPYAGHEKGCTERKVGYNRSNLFVPVPHIDDIEAFNKRLAMGDEEKAAEKHYKKGVLISELFEEDRKVLLPLPPKKFDACRYEWLKADGYGKVCLDGKHYYSTRPENARQAVLVGIRAHTVDILEKTGALLVSHRRAYGDKRSDVADHRTSLAALLKNSGAWANSGIRADAPGMLRDYMDAQPKEGLKSCLRILTELSGQYGYTAAMEAMGMAAGRGDVNICDASVLAARITGYGIDTPPQPGPELSAYDEAFLGRGGERQC